MNHHCHPERSEGPAFRFSRANRASSAPARKLAFEPVGKPRSFALSATTRRTTTQVGGVAMADPQSFLDNLKNLRLVLSVALEHTQQNRNQFLKSATPEQLDEEFYVLETAAIRKRRQLDN